MLKLEQTLCVSKEKYIWGHLFIIISSLFVFYLIVLRSKCVQKSFHNHIYWPRNTFKGVLGVRSYFFYIYIYIYIYVLMCVYVSRTRFPSSRAIKDVYLWDILILYHIFMPLNLFHFASRRFFSAFSPFGGDDPYFPVPLYYIKM